MQPASRHTLGIVTIVTIIAIVHGTVAPRTAAAQAAKADACALVDAPALLRLTGRTDIFKGPQLMDPSEIPQYTSGCHFVGIEFFLDTPFTPESFARVRRAHETTRGPFKVQSVSGLGDEAYYLWDTRPGKPRSVGLEFRLGNKRVIVAEDTHSDSIETMKKLLLSIAKTAAPRVK